MNWDKIIIDDFIFLNKSFDCAEAAIQFVGERFCEKHYATPAYTAAMLAMYEKYKGIIVLDDGIAMPHARPEEGALKEGLIFIQLNQALDFANEDFEQVKFVVGLVSSGSEHHLKLIQLVGNLIEQGIQHQSFNSKHELKAFIHQVIQQENL